MFTCLANNASYPASIVLHVRFILVCTGEIIYKKFLFLSACCVSKRIKMQYISSIHAHFPLFHSLRALQAQKYTFLLVEWSGDGFDFSLSNYRKLGHLSLS